MTSHLTVASYVLTMHPHEMHAASRGCILDSDREHWSATLPLDGPPVPWGSPLGGLLTLVGSEFRSPYHQNPEIRNYFASIAGS